MTEGRGLLTEREREAIKGESSDNYRYKTRTYIRRRLPHRGQDVELIVDVPSSLEVDVNQELFAWVLENLLKNALDAIEEETGTIQVRGGRADGHVFVEVADTGSGIRRHQWGNVFRPAGGPRPGAHG